jgi:glycosyltransferase involved in cell wall biosynthesis
MRVALVSPLFESVPPRKYGGTERVVYNLCRGLKERGVEVTLFASGDSNAGVPLVPLIDESLRLREKPVADPYAYNLRALELVSRHADEFDVIHNHHDYWMLPLSRMTGVPLLTTLHGRLDVPALSFSLLDWRDGDFVAISDSQRRGLPQLPWVRTIHHGIVAEEFDFHETPGRYLAFLGRISPEKRPDWAIEIAKASGIPLKIAAKIEGAESQEYFERVVRPQVDGRFIEFVGEIPEEAKSRFLGEAYALVFPIDWPEPFGLVVIEALACGTPVLARPLGAIPEITQDGLTGFSDLSVANLARKARDITRISRRACRQWVQDRFSLRRMTEDYLDVYGTLSRMVAWPKRDRHRRHLLHPV